jgi:NTP pyrophosphatase (non-canonical NTP hydrolase)
MPRRRGIMDHMRTQTKYTVLNEIADERDRQDAKWGPQNHEQMTWLGILAEEFGEAAKEINELHFRRAEAHLPSSLARTRAELIQVAAVAVAMVESLDRNGR